MKLSIRHPKTALNPIAIEIEKKRDSPHQTCNKKVKYAPAVKTSPWAKWKKTHDVINQRKAHTDQGVFHSN